jgi:iron complex transport system ATP-binding protein
MTHPSPLLRSVDLAVGYGPGTKGRISIAKDISIEIYPGQLICLLGPNGAGKSTLLRTLSGLQSPLEGRTEVTGINTRKLRPEDFAKKISLVLTDNIRNSNLSVDALVALGRYPYSGWFGTLKKEDQAIIHWAMKVTGVDAFAQRKVSTLSDGESQKVMLARALAQDTPLMMLDEPTAHLDLPSRIQLMRLLHHLAVHTRKGILLSTHDLDLALQVADQVWLMQKEMPLQKGAPEDLVLNGTFAAIFDKEGILFDKASGSFHIQQDATRTIRLTGEGIPAFWTKRALLRRGFAIAEASSAAPHIHISAIPHIRIVDSNDTLRWILDKDGSSQEHTTLADLLQQLDNSSPSTAPIKKS